MTNNQINIVVNLLGEFVKKGDNYMFHCPFCGFSKNKRPHLGVDFKKGVYGCFRCGTGGKLVNLIRTFIPSYKPSIKTKIQYEENPQFLNEIEIKVIEDLKLAKKSDIDYIESRLGNFDEFVDTIKYNCLPFFITDDSYLITYSLYGSYISFRSLNNNIKKLLKIKAVEYIDPFIYKVNPSDDDIANIFVFEGMFDMLTHLIHMNKGMVNSYYIIFNGKISKKLSVIINNFIVEEEKNIFLFKDSDVLINDLKTLKRYFNNGENMYIYYFLNSKDLNESFINGFNDIALVRV